MLKAKEIPTETFVTANQRIMATIMGGAPTRDRNFGISGLHAPNKYAQTMVTSARVKLYSDGKFHEPYDSFDNSNLTSRGYVENTNAVFANWSSGDFAVEDLYFIPPELDVLIHRFKVTNTGNRSHDLKIFTILFPYIGSGLDYKKGACQQCYYDPENACIITTDSDGNWLGYALAHRPDAWQVGQLCGNTDVYYDLEKGRLSCNSRHDLTVVNSAFEINSGTIEAGQTVEYQLCLTVAQSLEELQARIASFRSDSGLYQSTLDYWRDWLDKGVDFGDLSDFGEDARQFVDTSKIMVKTHQNPDGVLMCGSTASDYQGAVCARNACYSLIGLGKAGYPDEIRDGIKFFLDFKVGDDRFCSPDENDQIGTIIHSFKRYYDLSGDVDFLKADYHNIKSFAEALISLIDKDWGLIYSERSIHEFAAISRGYEMYVNVMACRGLLDAAFIAEIFDDLDAQRYTKYAELIRLSIMEKLYCAKTKSFAKRIYQGKLDMTPAISMYTPALFDIIDAKDSKVTGTINYLLDNIWDEELGGLYRYPLDLMPWEGRPYAGPWVTYTCWLAKIYIKQREFEKAADCIKWVIANCPSDSCSIPEHFSKDHAGKRGYHRVYYFPATPETWATAEFVATVADYQRATGKMATEKVVVNSLKFV
jgi:GH15 family glucan-1,4-alpha-glucosidase